MIQRRSWASFTDVFIRIYVIGEVEIGMLNDNKEVV